MFLFFADNNTSSDEGTAPSTTFVPTPSTSSFTVSSHSAFQRSVPRSPAERLERYLIRNRQHPNIRHMRDMARGTIFGSNAFRPYRDSVLSVPSDSSESPLYTGADPLEQPEEMEGINEQEDLVVDDENSGEQSETGYWLLEENSNSDSNLDDSNVNSNSRWTSRWIRLDQTNRNNSEAAAQAPEADRSQEQSDQYVWMTRDSPSTSERNVLSPVSQNPTRYEQPPLFPFRSLRESQLRMKDNEKRKNAVAQTTAVVGEPSTSSFNLESSSTADASSAKPPSTGETSTSMSVDNNETEAMATVEAVEEVGETSVDNVEVTEESAGMSIDGPERPSEEEGFRGWPADEQEGFSAEPLGVRQGIRLLSRHIDNMQRLCRYFLAYFISLRFVIFL